MPLFIFRKRCFNFEVLRRLWSSLLACRGKHVFYKNTVALGGVCYQDVGDGSDEFTVLNDGAATHECGQEGTTVFNKKFTTKYWLNFCRNSL